MDWASVLKIIQTIIAVLAQVLPKVVEQGGGTADPQNLKSAVGQHASGAGSDKQHHIEQAVQHILEAARSR